MPTISSPAAGRPAMPARRSLRRRAAGAGLTLTTVAALLGGLAGPAAAAGGTTLGNGPYNLRSGPSVNATVVGSIGSNQAVTIECTATGDAVTGTYGTTTVWDRLPGGAYISDALVYTGTDGPAAPACPPTTGVGVREDRAVAWAKSMIGATGYDGYCEKFVEHAYGTDLRYTSARANFEAQRAAGRINYSSANIPAGALVFSDNPYAGVYGHVMVSLGNGSFVTSAATVRTVNLAWAGTFRGWSYAPTSWAGR